MKCRNDVSDANISERIGIGIRVLSVAAKNHITKHINTYTHTQTLARIHFNQYHERVHACF